MIVQVDAKDITDLEARAEEYAALLTLTVKQLGSATLGMREVLNPSGSLEVSRDGDTITLTYKESDDRP